MVDHSSSRQPDDVLSDWQKLFGARVKINYNYFGANPGFGAGHNHAFAHCNQWSDYFLYFEDFDLSLRAGRLGLSAYCPGMARPAFGGGVARKGWRHIACFARSAARFFNTHGWRG